MKSVLITGANRGFGKALFDLYHSKGWKVFPIVRKPEYAESLLLQAQDNCYPVIADLRDEDFGKKIIERLESHTDSLDLLINNAGYIKKIEGVLPMTGDDLVGHFKSNVVGPWECSKACFPFLQKSTSGMIINVSSRRGTFDFNINHPLNRAHPYKITKVGLNMLTVIMDQEFSQKGVRVFAIHPGRLKTRVAPPDADATPEEAAQKLYKWIETFDRDQPSLLYDIMDERVISW